MNKPSTSPRSLKNVGNQTTKKFDKNKNKKSGKNRLTFPAICYIGSRRRSE